jgi:hypothetical protein
MKLLVFIIPIIIICIQACSSLSLKPAEFSWPVESVLKINNEGFVREERYSLYFNVKEMFLEETEDSLSFRNKEIRMLRDSKGFYFITSDNFKNVYVFNVYEGKFSMENKILISETGIKKPVLNQRPPYVELLEGGNQHLLSHKGLMNEEEDEE